jgi:hypothetical protein
MGTEETTSQMTNLIAIGAGLYVLDRTMKMGSKRSPMKAGFAMNPMKFKR